MKGLPNYRKYPMGDVVNANLEPGEYVVRRSAVNSIGTENMELLNHADGAHGALNKLMVSASLVHLQPQDNSPVKIEANGFPIADSPVRQRVDATRNMQEGGEVERRRLPMLSGLWGERSNIVEDEKGKKIQMIYSIPAGQVGEGGAGQYKNAEEMLADQHNKRYYLGESDYYKTDDRDYLRQVIEPLYAKTDARIKMAYSPADSIPQAMVENYFDQFRQEEAPVETPKKKSRLRSLLGMQNGGEVKTIRGASPVEYNYDDPEMLRAILSVPASEVGGGEGLRYYLGEKKHGQLPSLDRKVVGARAMRKMAYSPADSIPQAMVEGYFDKPSKASSFLKRLGINKQEGGVIKKDSECVGGECAVPSAVNQEGYYSMPWKGKNVMIDTMSRMEEDGVAQYLAEGEGGDYFMMNESDIPADSLKAWSGNGYQEGGPIPYSEGSDWGEMNKEWARQKFLSDLDPSTMGLMENIRSKDRIDPATAELFARLKGKSVEPSLNGISPQEIKSAGGYQEGGEVPRFKSKKDFANYYKDVMSALKSDKEMSGDEYGISLYEGADSSKVRLLDKMSEQFWQDNRKKLLDKTMFDVGYERSKNIFTGKYPVGKQLKNLEEYYLNKKYGKGLQDSLNIYSDFQEGGQVPSGNWGPKGAYNEALEQSRREDMSPKELQAMAMLDSLRQSGGERLESLPSDSYGGKEIPKNAMTIIPYLKSFGRMRTPLQEQERFMFQRYGLNPDALPPQLQGLRGLALRQRMGNEGI